MTIKINFMIVGAMKSGTSNLAAQLREHSQICFCKKKEPHYFSTTIDWDQHLKQYHNLFLPLDSQICGEASTSYSFLGEYPQVVNRLYTYNHNLKFIYLVRDPVERIRSHYSHRLMRGIANKNPWIDIENNENEYINRSLYGFTVQEYLKSFPSKQLLVLDFIEYITSPDTVIKRVCKFLEIPYENISSISARNSSVGSNRTPMAPIFYLDKVLAYSPPALRRFLSKYMDVKLRRKPIFSKELELTLWDILDNDIKLFEKLTEINVTPWRQKRVEAATKIERELK